MTDMVGLLIGVVDWGYLVGYCIEMAYRKTVRKSGGKKKAGLRRSKRAGLSRSKRGGQLLQGTPDSIHIHPGNDEGFAVWS